MFDSIVYKSELMKTNKVLKNSSNYGVQSELIRKLIREKCSHEKIIQELAIEFYANDLSRAKKRMYTYEYSPKGYGFMGINDPYL